MGGLVPQKAAGVDPFSQGLPTAPKLGLLQRLMERPSLAEGAAATSGAEAARVVRTTARVEKESCILDWSESRGLTRRSEERLVGWGWRGLDEWELELKVV